MKASSLVPLGVWAFFGLLSHAGAEGQPTAGTDARAHPAPARAQPAPAAAGQTQVEPPEASGTTSASFTWQGTASASTQVAPRQGNMQLLPPDQGDRREDEHSGAFGRLTLGLGLGHVRGERLSPEPGFRPIDDVSHTAPVLGLALLFGGGAEDWAIAGELMYERMLTRLEEPSKVSFSLYGLGVTASTYSDDEWFLTAHLRWLMMLLWKSEIPCWVDRGDATMGPGVGLTLGKEWFDKNDDDEDAIGLALQLNYAALSGKPELDYYSALLLLTLTSF